MEVFFNIIEFDWEAPEYTIEIVNNSEEMGMTFGAGVYHLGDTITLTATPNNGYSFQSWTENGLSVCSEPIYSFIAERDRSLMANFGGTGIGEIEESSKVFVFAKNRELFIEGADGLSEVAVFNVHGNVVYKGLRRRITMPCSGLYIVAIENRRMKVVVE